MMDGCKMRRQSRRRASSDRQQRTQDRTSPQSAHSITVQAHHHISPINLPRQPIIGQQAKQDRQVEDRGQEQLPARLR